MSTIMASDYPNPYENTDYGNYQDPYMVDQGSNDSYNYSNYGQNGYADMAEFNDQDSYASADSYGQYGDSDHSSRSGDQDERDRYIECILLFQIGSNCSCVITMITMICLILVVLSISCFFLCKHHYIKNKSTNKPISRH